MAWSSKRIQIRTQAFIKGRIRPWSSDLLLFSITIRLHLTRRVVKFGQRFARKRFLLPWWSLLSPKNMDDHGERAICEMNVSYPISCFWLFAAYFFMTQHCHTVRAICLDVDPSRNQLALSCLTLNRCTSQEIWRHHNNARVFSVRMQQSVRLRQLVVFPFSYWQSAVMSAMDAQLWPGSSVLGSLRGELFWSGLL